MTTCSLFLTNKCDNNQCPLTGHPHHFLSHCQASPSLPLLSPFLKVLPQTRGEAARVDLSLQQEVPLQVPVTKLPLRDPLKTTKKDLFETTLAFKPMLIKTVESNSSIRKHIWYLTLDWLLEGG